MEHFIKFLLIMEHFIADDLPVRGFIGHLEERGFLPHKHEIFLWNHITFNFEYNNDEVALLFTPMTIGFYTEPLVHCYKIFGNLG